MSYLKQHWLFSLPLLIFLTFYTLQNIPCLMYLPTDLVLQFIVALSLAVVSYIGAYLLVPIRWSAGFAVSFQWIERASLAIVVGFVALMILCCVTADRIPLVEALKGASFSQLFDDRNNFLKGRIGSGQILNYGFAIMVQSLMPLAVAVAFWSRASWRWPAAVLFTIGTSLTLAKSSFVYVAVPLIALFLMQARWKAAAAMLCAFVVMLAVMSTLSSGIVGKWEALARGEKVKESQVELPSDTPERYNIFHQRTALALMANRIVWIPYVTALDWFRFQQEKLDGVYVLGRSIRPVAFLLGEPHLPLEKRVAELQWGTSSGATSNAVFVADAWLNWGPLGVIVYAILLALTIKLIQASNYPPLIAASAMPVWLTGVSALPPVYFSGGLGFLLVAALALRTESVVNDYAPETQNSISEQLS